MVVVDVVDVSVVEREVVEVGERVVTVVDVVV